MMSYNMEMQLSITFFSGEKTDKTFKIEISTTQKEATIWCPDCFTQLTKQNKHTCKNCEYKITDKFFENTENR
jgi:Zn finger protein HypA/HybF involved in hydrogenase expression